MSDATDRPTTEEPASTPEVETAVPPKKKRVKWEPYALMLLTIGLALWLFQKSTSFPDGAKRMPDSQLVQMKAGNNKSIFETWVPIAKEGEPALARQYRLLDDGFKTEPMTAEAFAKAYGPATLHAIDNAPTSWFYRVFNITSPVGMIWVTIGLFGQVLFFLRMAVQWIMSEKKRESIVPPLFWYLSFIGGLSLMTYFVWRQDLVGVLGQTTGIVIYGRNIRLIGKQKRRAARRAALEDALLEDVLDDAEQDKDD